MDFAIVLFVSILGIVLASGLELTTAESITIVDGLTPEDPNGELKSLELATTEPSTTEFDTTSSITLPPPIDGETLKTSVKKDEKGTTLEESTTETKIETSTTDGTSPISKIIPILQSITTVSKIIPAFLTPEITVTQTKTYTITTESTIPISKITSEKSESEITSTPTHPNTTPPILTFPISEQITKNQEPTSEVQLTTTVQTSEEVTSKPLISPAIGAASKLISLITTNTFNTSEFTTPNLENNFNITDIDPTISYVYPASFYTPKPEIISTTATKPTVSPRLGTAFKLISIVSSTILNETESTTPKFENNLTVSKMAIDVSNIDPTVTTLEPEITTKTMKNITSPTIITEKTVTKLPAIITSPESELISIELTPESGEISSEESVSVEIIAKNAIVYTIPQDKIPPVTKPEYRSTTEIQVTASEHEEIDVTITITEVPQNTSTEGPTTEKTLEIAHGASLILPISMVCGSLLLLFVTCALISLKRRRERRGNLNLQGGVASRGSLLRNGQGNHRAHHIPQDNSDVPRFIIAMEKMPIHAEEDC